MGRFWLHEQRIESWVHRGTSGNVRGHWHLLQNLDGKHILLQYRRAQFLRSMAIIRHTERVMVLSLTQGHIHVSSTKMREVWLLWHLGALEDGNRLWNLTQVVMRLFCRRVLLWTLIVALDLG